MTNAASPTSGGLSLVAELSLKADDLVSSAAVIPRRSFQTLRDWLSTEPVLEMVRLNPSLPEAWDSLSDNDRNLFLLTGLAEVSREDSSISLNITESLQLKLDQPLREMSIASLRSAPSESADQSVLILSEGGKVWAAMADALCNVLTQSGFAVTKQSSYLISREHLDYASKFNRIVAIVTGVGTAAETLHLLHNYGLLRTLPSSRPFPEIHILVQRQFSQCYFGRAVVEAHSGQVLELPEAADDFGQGVALLQRLVDDWKRAGERTSQSLLASSTETQMDDQSRRSARRLWQEG